MSAIIESNKSEVERLRSKIIEYDMLSSENEIIVLKEYDYLLGLNKKSSIPHFCDIVEKIMSINIDKIYDIADARMRDICVNCDNDTGKYIYPNSSTCAECFDNYRDEFIQEEEYDAGYYDIARVVYKVLNNHNMQFITNKIELIEDYGELFGIYNHKLIPDKPMLYNDAQKILIPELVEDGLYSRGRVIVRCCCECKPKSVALLGSGANE